MQSIILFSIRNIEGIVKNKAKVIESDINNVYKQYPHYLWFVLTFKLKLRYTCLT